MLSYTSVLKIIWFSLTGFCFFSSCSSETDKKSAAGQMEINCSPKTDTLTFVKNKIEKLLSTAQEYSENTKKKEIDCIKSLCPNVKILIIESSASGENYHKLEQLIEKNRADVFVIDTIKVNQNNNSLKFRILGKFEKVKQQTSNNESDVNFKMPTTFQGMVKGKRRRIKIDKIEQAAKNIKFNYSIIGSYNEQNKPGTIDLNNSIVNFETLGQGKFQIVNGEMLIKFEENDSEILSIN